MHSVTNATLSMSRFGQNYSIANKINHREYAITTGVPISMPSEKELKDYLAKHQFTQRLMHPEFYAKTKIVDKAAEAIANQEISLVTIGNLFRQLLNDRNLLDGLHLPEQTINGFHLNLMGAMNDYIDLKIKEKKNPIEDKRNIE